MFLAVRSLLFQRGRYALIGLVIGLLALLTVMLSGLSTGLVNDVPGEIMLSPHLWGTLRFGGRP